MIRINDLFVKIGLIRYTFQSLRNLHTYYEESQICIRILINPSRRQAQHLPLHDREVEVEKIIFSTFSEVQPLQTEIFAIFTWINQQNNRYG